MLDADGYPDEEALEAIKQYDIITQPVDGLIALVKENWWAPDWGFGEHQWRATILEGDEIDSGQGLVYEGDLTLHTGGWSGNEAIIAALQQIPFFWSQYLVFQRRGGHYYFARQSLRDLQAKER